MVANVTPAEAKRLIDDEGYAYLDVRTVEEFDAGHPAGAYNVPIVHAGMTPNGEFVSVVEAAFPKDAHLVVGCKSGGRSARAAEILASRGYENVVNMDGGFHGRFSPFGELAQSGWAQEGLPTETTSDERNYQALRDRSSS
jgi:rhodanese-related sulfurtransferase